MNRIRIAIMGASEIAYRRFVPALLKDPRFEYVGVAIEREQDVEKAGMFLNDYGGEIMYGYDSSIARNDIDAIYVPQPPALHFNFGRKVLESNKHLFMEKPFTINLSDTEELITMASEKRLAAVENYMFRFHKQIDIFTDFVNNKKIVGDVDKYEVRFSFPRRSTNDFRYNKSLGGGALFDCGGYTIMLADILLEGRGKILDFAFEYLDGFEVDMGGMGRMTNEERECCFSFGMAHPYNCYLKARGTKGVLIAPRVLTAPSDFDVKFDLLDNHGDMVKQIDGRA